MSNQNIIYENFQLIENNKENLEQNDELKTDKSNQFLEKQVSYLNSQLTLIKEQNAKQVSELKQKINEQDQKLKDSIEKTNNNHLKNIQDLEKRLSDSQNQLIQQQQNQKQIQSNFDSLFKLSQSQDLEKKQLQKQKTELQQKLVDSEDIQSNLNMKIIQKEQQLTVLQCEKESLQKNLDDLVQQNSNQQEEISNLKKQISEQSEQVTNQQSNLEVAHKNIDNLLSEKEILNKFVPKIEESKYGYDIIIQMKSIKDLEESTDKNKSGGLRVEQYNKKIDQNFKSVIVIGTQGQKNKGKSFLLNSLIDESFPSDYHLSTPGISLKYHSLNNRSIIYLDTEGLNSPITMDYEHNQNYKKFIDSKRNNNKIDTQCEQNLQKDITESHQDLKATEQIQQEFIIESSDILMVVVSYLTLEDQKLIHQLQLKFVENKQNKKEKKIIVVHNIKDFRRPEYIKEYMEKIKIIFPVQERAINLYPKKYEDESNLIFVDNLKEDIHHVVMGHQQSEAGRVYNNFALYYIKHLIGMYHGISNFNVKNKLQDYMNKNLEYYVALNKETDEQEQAQNPHKKELIFFNEEKQALMLRKGIKIDKVKELQVNVFGALQKDCLYSIINSKNNNERYLLIEIPGNAKIKKRYVKQSGYFYIEMDQNKTLEDELGEIQATTRKFEQQCFCIQICNDKELWTFLKDRTKNLQNGIQMFVFEKEEDNNDFIEV